MPADPPNATAPITVDLVRSLLHDQFPDWADLPIVKVEPGGWDNRTFRLGDELSVRLPSADAYVPGTEKEQRWLPLLAPQLPVPVPTSVATGAPSAEFPRPWTINTWLDGEPATTARIPDPSLFARDLAGFLNALRAADATDGPEPGPHCFWRGGPVAFYDDDTRRALALLEGTIDTDAALDVWAAACASSWGEHPVWFHGDIAHGNLLVRDGRLAAVIDFGTSGVGDPACDLVIAWNSFDAPTRVAFRDALGWDDELWVRARGWAIWKALIVAAGMAGSHDPAREQANALRVIADVIAEHRASAEHTASP
ncbi:aminoglycoside phosphotransferase family protein [Rathayibacter sp. CAU 1779]